MKAIISFIIFSFIITGNLSAQERPYALVAGGSKGIGYAIAEALAKRGYNLVLVARHIDALQLAQTKLINEYHVAVEVLVYDLSKERNLKLKMLCNVAGLGGSNDYLSLPLDSLRYMVRLNIESAMALTYTLLPLLEQNAPSYILNVASMSAFAPIPSKNMYSATKSAVLFFSYGLREQLKNKHISVSCLAPGPVFTKPEIREQTIRQLGWIGKQMAVAPQKVGEVAIRETLHGKMIIVPGNLAKITSIFLRVLPRRWSSGIYAALNKPGVNGE